jgi:hypothetical protein
MSSGPRHHPTSAIDFLHRHEGAAALLPAAERMVRLTQDLAALLPPTLRASCDVTAFDDAIVTLRVYSAAVAAKLRQTLPRVQEALNARGWQVDGIRVRVRPRAASPQTVGRATTMHAGISSSGLEAFDALAGSLEESPLRAAVERLVRRREPRR